MAIDTSFIETDNRKQYKHIHSKVNKIGLNETAADETIPLLMLIDHVGIKDQFIHILIS